MKFIIGVLCGILLGYLFVSWRIEVAHKYYRTLYREALASYEETH